MISFSVSEILSKGYVYIEPAKQTRAETNTIHFPRDFDVTGITTSQGPSATQRPAQEMFLH